MLYEEDKPSTREAIQVIFKLLVSSELARSNRIAKFIGNETGEHRLRKTRKCFGGRKQNNFNVF